MEGKKKLGDITCINAPFVDPKEENYMNLFHIGPERIEKETGELLQAKTAEEDGLISGKFLFNEQHVLYSKIRPYLRKVALPDFTGLCSADIYPVSPRKEFLTREYLWSVLISRAFSSYTESIPGRANIPKINRQEFAAYKCMLPPLEIQRIYTETFKHIKKYKNKQIDMMNFYNICYKSLAQRAFCGEI